ncbi:MAG: phytanoyl-CoA dioxygenase family protein [Cyanobacteria bacterium J06597_16]
MTTSLSTAPLEISAEQKARFHEQGYLVVDNLLSQVQVSQIIERCDRLFHTQFETGIYPDEWYGRPGLSQPNATRQMTGLWRCDRTLASFTLSSAIARLNAALMGWKSARYGLDTFWAKPPNAPALYFHRNNTYVQAIAPSEAPTCWIALDNAAATCGTLEIVPGSHLWPTASEAGNARFLHAPKEDYRTPLWEAATQADITKPKILPIEIPNGSAVFLHGALWHGSGPNPSQTNTRQSLSIATLQGTAQYGPPGGGNGYIFDRYRLRDTLSLQESFYPILWCEEGHEERCEESDCRTPFLTDYCQDALTP